MSSGKPARYWRRLADGRVQCRLCPRLCTLEDGQRGVCFVRRCEKGELVLTTWGRSSGFCVDPIEKKPLHHFLPGTPVLSFGTAGCNMLCSFCQNWELSKARETEILGEEAPPEKVAAAALRLGCRSVAYTYNDPVIFSEYALDCAAACREVGVRSVAVTAGYIRSRAREDFFAGMDAANIDLKAFDDDFYRRHTGARLAPVLETIEYVASETDVWLELTTLLIPGENDSEAEIERLCDWVLDKLGPDLPLHFSAFHPAFKLSSHPPTPASTLDLARRIALNHGLHHVYTGNVHDSEGGSTYCPGCGALLIARDWYRLGAWGLDESGKCRSCARPCAGVFEAKPGDWGQRRLPVRLDEF